MAVEWGRYQEAFKAIHDKLNEILSKLDQPSDPAIHDVVDRADRLLGKVCGEQGVLKQLSTRELEVVGQDLWEPLWKQDFEAGLGAFVRDGGAGDTIARDSTTSYDGGYSCKVYSDNVTPFYCFAWAGMAAKTGTHRIVYHFGKFSDPSTNTWGTTGYGDYLRFDLELVDEAGNDRLSRVYYRPGDRKLCIKTTTVEQDVIATLTYGLAYWVWHELIVDVDLTAGKYIQIMLDGKVYDVSAKTLYVASTSYQMSGLYKVGIMNAVSQTAKEVFFDDCRVYHELGT